MAVILDFLHIFLAPKKKLSSVFNRKKNKEGETCRKDLQLPYLS